jgi:hypothetical protein
MPYTPVGWSGTVTGVAVTPVVALELPNSLVPTIVNVYCVPVVSPVTVHGLPQHVCVNVFEELSVPVTTYVACAPFSLPSVKVTVTAVPVSAAGAALMECGWSGRAPIVMPVSVTADAGPVPSAFCRGRGGARAQPRADAATGETGGARGAGRGRQGLRVRTDAVR